MDRINLFKQKKVPFQSQEARLGRALDVEQKRKHQRAQELNRVRAVDDGIQEGKCNISNKYLTLKFIKNE